MTKNENAAARAKEPPRKEPPQRGELAEPDAGLQSRLVEAQSAMDRDYVRLREFEARYRHLFVATTEPLLVVDANSLRVLDANPAACAVLGIGSQKLVGASVLTAFESRSHGGLQALSAELLRGGQPGRVRVESATDGKRLLLSASVFRHEGSFVLMLRIEASDGRAPRGERSDIRDGLSAYGLAAPDPIVLTDLSGKVLQANDAFVELVQATTERQVRGESLGRWLGRTSVDLGVLVTNLRQRGKLKLFSTYLRAEHGGLTDVEISAALVSTDAQAILGFTIRDVGRRLVGSPQAGNDMSKSVSQLAELVGRLPLKEIVGNTAELIEKMCIEAALQLTRNNRAAAAELLGLSRQSLYVKLRRYDMSEGESDGAE